MAKKTEKKERKTDLSAGEMAELADSTDKKDVLSDVEHDLLVRTVRLEQRLDRIVAAISKSKSIKGM